MRIFVKPEKVGLWNAQLGFKYDHHAVRAKRMLENGELYFTFRSVMTSTAGEKLVIRVSDGFQPILDKNWKELEYLAFGKRRGDPIPGGSIGAR
jgi:hypothetical protein